MPVLPAVVQICMTVAKWIVLICALALHVTTPSPRHSARPGHHQPVRLPELAVAGGMDAGGMVGDANP